MAAVITQMDGRVMTITLNRPETRNALDEDILTGLIKAMAQAKEDDLVRSIILSGGPGRFCSGLNLKHVSALSDEERPIFLAKVMAAFSAVITSEKPVMAAIDGPALAGGFDLAVMCHIRYASIRASFGQPEILIGFSQLIDPLWKIIGLGRARELALTGRIYDAREAFSLGLVSQVFSPHELSGRVLEVAQELAERRPEAIAATLENCNRIPGLPLEEALAEQGQVFLDIYDRPETPELVKNFLASIRK